MARKKRKRIEIEEAEVPLSSMIDIVFLLLIYFIFTQKPIIEDTLLGVNLPSPHAKPSQPQEEKPQFFRIGVYKVGSQEQSPDLYYINDKGPYKLSYLRDFLKSVAENDPEQTVMINCGPNATHKKLIQVLDACAEAKMKNLNILNDEAIQFQPYAYSKARY